MEAILNGWKNELFQSISPLEENEKRMDEAFAAETQRIRQIINVVSSTSEYPGPG